MQVSCVLEAVCFKQLLFYRYWTPNVLVLQANPNIVCGDALHNGMVGISTPMLLLNFALFPCGTLAIMFFGKNSGAQINRLLNQNLYGLSLNMHPHRCEKAIASQSQIHETMGIHFREIRAGLSLVADGGGI